MICIEMLRVCLQRPSAPLVLTNKNGMQLHVTNVGAAVQRLLVPDAQGLLQDVVMGFDNPALYQVSWTAAASKC